VHEKPEEKPDKVFILRNTKNLGICAVIEARSVEEAKIKAGHFLRTIENNAHFGSALWTATII
jgi:hypothetical protein